MGKTEITCILIDKEEGLFISILDEVYGYVELRVNDKSPFGYPIDEINQGDVFTITHETKPGTIYYKVDTGEIYQYVKILENKALMEYMNKYYSDELSRIDLHQRVEELREKKIDKIIK